MDLNKASFILCSTWVVQSGVTWHISYSVKDTSLRVTWSSFACSCSLARLDDVSDPWNDIHKLIWSAPKALHFTLLISHYYCTKKTLFWSKKSHKIRDFAKHQYNWYTLHISHIHYSYPIIIAQKRPFFG